jgi:hypothetical protein
MSGASEATLQELLEVNRSMADAIRGLASKGGGGSGGGGGGGTSSLSTAGKALNDVAKGAGQLGAILGTGVNVALGTFKTALNIASAGFNAFKKVGDSVIQSQKQLAKTMEDGSGTIASFAESLSGLPFHMGLVADAVAHFARVQMKELTTFQEMSKAGVNLGGSLTEVRGSAMAMGLSMDEFGQVMKNNAANFARMGGTAEEGARNMINFNKSFVKGETGRELGNLGLTAVELNNAMGNFAEVSGGISQEQLKDTRALSAQIKSYNEELIMTAELTGKNREEMEKEMKERAKQAARDLMLSQMTGEEKKRFLAAEQAAMRIGGKGAADALLSMTLGLPPMTKEARTFTAVNAQANKEVVKLNQATKDKSLSEAQFTKQIDDSTAKGRQATRDMVKSYGQTANALSFQSGAVADSMKDSMHQVSNDIANGVTDNEKGRKQVEKTREGILKAEKEGTAGAANQAAMAAKYQGQVMEALYAALAELWPIVEELVMGFTHLLVAAMPLIKQGINFIKNLYSDVIKPAFMALFGGMNIEDILAPFKAFVKGLFGDNGGDLKTIGLTIQVFLTKVRTFFSDMFGAIDFEGVGKKVRETFNKVFGALGKIATSLGKLFGGGGGGPDGAQVGSALEKAFTVFLDIVGGIADIIGDIVEQFTQTPLFQTLKEMIDSLVRIFTGVVNIIKKIVAGPIGTWLVKALSAAGDLFIAPFKLAIDAIDFMVQLIDGFIDIFKGDSEKGWKTVGDATKRMLKSIIDWFLKIPKFLWEFFGGSWASVSKAITDLVDGFVDAVTGFFSKIFSFFSSSAKEKAEAKVANSTPPTSTPSTPADPKKWAHDVYLDNSLMPKVPAEIKGDVQKLLNNPDKAWVEEVNRRTQANSKPPEPKTAPPKTAEAPKPAPVAQADLNNKDAIGLLKTIADYQYKTVNAVTALNGNLYRK